MRLGMLLVDDNLEFLAGRCRPNTVIGSVMRSGLPGATDGRPLTSMEVSGLGSVAGSPATPPRRGPDPQAVGGTGGADRDDGRRAGARR